MDRSFALLSSVSPTPTQIYDKNDPHISIYLTALSFVYTPLFAASLASSIFITIIKSISFPLQIIFPILPDL